MKYFNKTSLSLGLVVMFGYLSMFNGSGSSTSNGDRTGAPFGNGTCSGGGSSCHGSTGSFSPTTTLTLLSGTTPVTSYASNTSYTLRVVIASTGTSSSTRYGFQAVSVKSGSPYAAINNWGTMPTQTKKTITISSRNYASHSTRMTSGTVLIPWTSPATSTGNVTFYVAGMVSNNNFNQSGDNVATTSLTITPASSGCTTPAMTPTVTHVDCFDGQTGAISVGLAGGTTPFSYDWTGPSGYSASTKDITGLKAGTYRLIVTANGGCKDTINPVVNQPPTLSASITASSPYCAATNMQISAAGNGGNGAPYSYAWEGPSGSLGATQMITVNNVAVTDSGDYIVTVTDPKNCSVKDTVNIQVDSLPMADGIIVDTVSHNTFNFSIDNPRYADNILWQFGDGKTATTAAATNTYTTNNTYEVKLIMSNHCGSDTLKLSQNVWPQSVQDNSKSDYIKIYPNPADGIITIINKGQDSIQGIRLVSLQGTSAYISDIAGQSEIHINTSKYANGIYILHVTSENKSYTYPLSIKH